LATIQITVMHAHCLAIRCLNKNNGHLINFGVFYT
jgi:hypothetical protein